MFENFRPVLKTSSLCVRCGVIASVTVCLLSGLPASAVSGVGAANKEPQDATSTSTKTTSSNDLSTRQTLSTPQPGESSNCEPSSVGDGKVGASANVTPVAEKSSSENVDDADGVKVTVGTESTENTGQDSLESASPVQEVSSTSSRSAKQTISNKTSQSASNDSSEAKQLEGAAGDGQGPDGSNTENSLKLTSANSSKNILTAMFAEKTASTGSKKKEELSNGNANANNSSTTRNLNTNSINGNSNKNNNTPGSNVEWGPWKKLDETYHQRTTTNGSSKSEKAKHSWNGGKETKKATCTESGTIAYTCTVCGATKKESTEPLGHKWAAWEKVDDINCRRVCQNDPSHIESSTHNWNDGVVTIAPTESAPGTKTYTCSKCGARKQEEIPATGSGKSSSSGSSRIPVPTPQPYSGSGGGSSSSTSTDSSLVSSTKATTSEDDDNRDHAQEIDVSYTCSAGNDTQWAKGSSSSANMTFKRSEQPDRTIDHFTGIKIDGKDLTEDKYEKQPGDGLTIKFLPSYLETLASGSHIVVASFDDGQPVSAKFTVTSSLPSASPSATSGNSSGRTPVPTSSTAPSSSSSSSQNQSGQSDYTSEQTRSQRAPGPMEASVPLAASAAFSLVALPLALKRRRDRGGLF